MCSKHIKRAIKMLIRAPVYMLVSPFLLVVYPIYGFAKLIEWAFNEEEDR